MRTLLCLFLFVAAALAQDVESVSPACGAPGDRLLITGTDFGEDPVVTIGTTEVEVLKSDDTRIVVRVPEDATAGDTTVSVGGSSANFEVLVEGAPVVLWTSAEKGTAGMRLFLFGRRLKDATADVLDSDGNVAGAAEIVGGRRALFLTLPEDLDPGDYTIRIANDEGDTGGCSPAIEIVEAGDSTVDSAEPENQLPGGPVTFKGANLGALGLVRVVWTDGEGNETKRPGFSNGFDTVWSYVPRNTVEGETYEVTIMTDDTTSTAPLAYDVGTRPPPSLTELEYDTGPAGSTLAIFGTNLFAGKFALPTVEFIQGEESTEAKVVFAAPGRSVFGGGFEDDVVVVKVPDLADGDYDVMVGDSSNTLPFTVADLPLAVTDMSPDTQGRRIRPVLIEGTGFGPYDGDPIAVEWDDGEEVRKGIILFRSDRQLFVIPPGGWFNPLPEGEYTVRVVLSPDGESPESVEAGTYTVE